MRRAARVAAVALTAGAAAAAWSAFVGWPHLAGHASALDAAESVSVDLRLLLFGRVRPADAVVVVAVDDATLALEGNAAVLSRGAMARLIDRIADDGARAVAVDVLFQGATDPAEDAALASALSRLPSVVASAMRYDEGAGPAPRMTRLVPHPPFAAAATVGMVNLATAPSGTPRHAPLVFVSPDAVESHFAVRAAAAFCGVEPVLSADAITIGPHVVPLDVGLQLPLRIAGRTGSVPTISAADVLAGAAGPRLAGRLAVVGVTASAAGDTFPTPFDPVLPGVEVLATAVSQLLGGPGLARTSEHRRVDVAAAMLLAVASVLAIAALPLATGVAFAIALLAGWLFLIGLAFDNGIWLGAALPVAAVLPASAVAATVRHVHERRLAARERAGLNRLRAFHPPALAARLAMDPAYLAAPVTRRLAMVFVDIAGFTARSETLGLAGTQALLNDFHIAVGEAVQAHGGVALNFLGDGALAVFGLPEPAPDDADRALAAARAMIAATQALGIGDVCGGDERGGSASDPTGADSGWLDARAAVHVDVVAVSRLGPSSHQHVTVTGDGVNLASRLMDVAKDAGMRLAVSNEALLAMRVPPSPPDATTTPAIRGRVGRVGVALWRLDPLASPAAAII